MARPFYEVAALDAAIDRLVADLPKQSEWPTYYAEQLVRRALYVSSIVTDLAITVASRAPAITAPHVRELADDVTKAQAALAEDVRKINTASLQGMYAANVALPGFRGRILDLLRTSARVWRGLLELRDMQPVLLTISASAGQEIRREATEIARIGRALYQRAKDTPPFPTPPPPEGPPAPPPEESPPARSRAPRIAAAILALLGAGVTVALVYRHQRRHQNRRGRLHGGGYVR